MKKEFRNNSWCFLEPRLIESEAFLNLSGKAAMLTVIRFHQKAYRKNTSKKKKGFKDLVITNQGQIIFTYGEARELGMKSSETFYRVLKELIEDKGFIDIESRGDYIDNEPTRYRISDRWREYGTKSYKAAKMQRVLPKGLGFQKQK